jgi:hypothetical protein
VRDVPDDVRDVLAAEAESRGQSLQLFLSELLAREAASARNLAWLREQRGRRADRVDRPSATRDQIRATWEERDRRISDDDR